jgi:hypothetical protein
VVGSDSSSWGPTSRIEREMRAAAALAETWFSPIAAYSASRSA